MSKYVFTTLAVGDDYVSNAVRFYRDLINSGVSCDLRITTHSHEEVDGIFINNLNLSKYHDDGYGFTFYLNLKVLALKDCLDKGYDYVVYSDSDWNVGSLFSEEKMMRMFSHMEEKGFDFLFERPAPIKGKNYPDCFFMQKISDYNVMEHSLWDEAHVVNEQFLVFKNNWKFRYFVMRWEQFLWYTIHNNIRNYPDGFEIGVSALEAGMSYSYDSFGRFLSDCFWFKDKQGVRYDRF